MPLPYFAPSAKTSSGFVTSYVPPGAKRLFAFAAYNHGAAAFVQVHDATAQPANGAVPLLVFPIASNAALYPPPTFMDVGRLFANGICLVLSTTDTTLTAAGANMVTDVISS